MDAPADAALRACQKLCSCHPVAASLAYGVMYGVIVIYIRIH
ncbi:MAG: hypothetical protein ACOYL0_15130 [Limnohabitans sp.]